jgi:hypothetical protein
VTYPANERFGYTWSPTAAECTRALADERAKKNPAAQHGDCQPISVSAGGPLWGMTFAGWHNFGVAVDQQAFCEKLRSLMGVMSPEFQASACSPVTVLTH